MFNTYLELGINHILDIEGYDHILFIIALCAVFGIKDWKKILILATAFTIGHSITLALAALDLVKFPAKVIEILIPITIIITAITNILRSDRKEGEDFPKWNYYLPLFFGLIHGLGFSTFFRALMGKSSEVILPLFAFNVGVELGQIVIIAITMLLSFLLVNLAGLKRNYWNLAVSILAIVVSCYLIYEKI
ncbi:MAG: HupE/UreJ family protein [Saprospiraceae bacterium]|nr:HupE/UreJ family protein [Saprospiraceae bacterium]HMS67381.1 HupE/UreJ family protein [Saprospiraceae bacterium]